MTFLKNIEEMLPVFTSFIHPVASRLMFRRLLARCTGWEISTTASRIWTSGSSKSTWTSTTTDRSWSTTSYANCTQRKSCSRDTRRARSRSDRLTSTTPAPTSGTPGNQEFLHHFSFFD